MENIRKIEFKELIELFIIDTIPNIQENEETPKFNIVFEPNGFLLFNYVKENPFKLDGHWTPNIRNRYIKKMKLLENQDNSLPTIYVKNAYLFFSLLLEIVNQSLSLNYKYDFNLNEREHCILVLRRIWLRMGPNDFNNVESFLKREVEFLKNDWLDIDYRKNYEKIDNFNENIVIKSSMVGETWDETFREISYSIVLPDRTSSHELSSVRYGLIEENNEKVCYIYAIQNVRNPKVNKKIQREIYKFCNKNGDLGVHPNQVFTMYQFLKELEKIGVTKVKIPIMQVLNYPYHEIMYSDGKNVHQSSIEYSEYISFLKTEKLYKIMEAMTIFFDDFYLINDLDTASDTLIYNFNISKKKNNTFK